MSFLFLHSRWSGQRSLIVVTGVGVCVRVMLLGPIEYQMTNGFECDEHQPPRIIELTARRWGLIYKGWDEFNFTCSLVNGNQRSFVVVLEVWLCAALEFAPTIFQVNIKLWKASGLSLWGWDEVNSCWKFDAACWRRQSNNPYFGWFVLGHDDWWKFTNQIRWFILIWAKLTETIMQLKSPDYTHSF